MNILLSSLGLKSVIVEEALGLFNYRDFDFYEGKDWAQKVNELRNTFGLTGHEIDEVWLIATDKRASDRGASHFNSISEDLTQLNSKAEIYGVKYRLFVLDNVDDIKTDAEAHAYHSMALEACCMARQYVGPDGGVYISLACGRKTMSADLQDAAYCFGCKMLMHVLGDTDRDALPLSLGAIEGNEVLSQVSDDRMVEDIVRFENNDSFLRKVEVRKSQSEHFYTSYYLEQDNRANFHILYTLPPSKIDALRKEHIGTDASKEAEELEYLRRLPKTELHCHLGGVLSAAEMIEVAKSYVPLIAKEEETNPDYKRWLDTLPTFVDRMREAPESWKRWYGELAAQLNVHKGLIVAPFLLAFDHQPDRLDSIIYEDYTDERNFQQIGIRQYEALGDLQGSALLCNEQAIRRTTQILLENCKRENVKYLEVRCSPINYVYKKLSAQKILRAILEELDKQRAHIKSSIVIIASRHGEESKIKESIELVKSMKGNPLFFEYFRGFDLAGAEEVREAKELRDVFLEIMKECYNITIHAGETVDSESIWQAVYYLNAERIGHGLTLKENKELQNKLLERSIGIEMCPSSNYQIRGFKDNYYPAETYSLSDYPLKEYLDQELKVSVNTDDPGISRTNVTQELLKAARLTKGGLSKWDILQLLCNGFRTAFYPYKEKRELIQEAEQCLAELIDKKML